jgi:hypothetical protein
MSDVNKKNLFEHVQKPICSPITDQQSGFKRRILALLNTGKNGH